MKEITVISGKGGTGKTSITAALLSLVKNALVIDCDVDAADMHLIVNGENIQKFDFYSGRKFYIDKDLCKKCGKCKEVCKFNAIHNEKIDNAKCESCGICFNFCPYNAIKDEERLCGQWYIADSRFGKFVSANLHIGEENSGKLVALIRKEAKKIAKQNNNDIIISDGPPGISCPVIASITGTGYVLIVTEPTLSGFHDLKRIVELIEHFKLKCGVCINKYDVNLRITDEIKKFCIDNNIECVGQIPYTKEFTEAQIKNKSIIEFSNSNVNTIIKEMWEKLENYDD